VSFKFGRKGSAGQCLDGRDFGLNVSTRTNDEPMMAEENNNVRILWRAWRSFSNLCLCGEKELWLI